MKSNLFLIVFIVVLTSCGAQRRLHQSAQKASMVGGIVRESSAKLDSLQKQASFQHEHAVKDTFLLQTIQEIITKLQRNLDQIGETISAVELLAQKKSNFTNRHFNNTAIMLVNRLDSFQAAGKARDRIYQLLSEAVSAQAFSKFDMGIFFEPGAYKIPLTAINKIDGPFKPAIDSMIQVSNNYPDVKHKIYMVFVGYADERSVAPGSPLYYELKRFLPPAGEPDRKTLNLTLSQLRANELQRNMKLIMAKNAPRFYNYGYLNIGYISYGRGEALPFKNITDYRANDERRRVVVFYWSVLPVVE